MEAPDPVVLSVSQIRQQVFEKSRGPVDPDARKPGSAAGRLFHLCASSVVNPNHPACWQAVLDDEPGGAERLAAALYDTVVGPELSRCRPAMAGEQLLDVWKAVRAYAQWFTRLIDSARQAGAIRYDAKHDTWQGAVNLFLGELEVTRQLYEPGWRAPVCITGVADQVIRAGESRWCIVEFKLGPGHLEADALQACLYHELLCQHDPQAASAAVLVRFGEGGPKELLLGGEAIRQARPALMNLIGRLAGVLGDAQPPAPPAAQGQQWPKPASPVEEELGRRILKTMAEFKSPARMAAEPAVGPAFVRFFVQPERGVTTAKLLRQGANLQVRLGVSREPVIHMVDGRIAIDVARPNREVVLFQHLEPSIPRHSEGSSKALVGIDLSNQVHFLDFAAPEHAHVLISGVAGSGKSEWLRTALASLLIANTPQTLRLILIDPKRNAFPDLERSPFLLHPGALLYPPQDDVLPVLEQLVDEMESRYERFAEARADDLTGYMRTGAPVLPRIVVACDEFADLVMAGRQQRAAVESVLNRLGQKARAAGIHLLLATQTPRREVITGILRANTPARVALRVTTSVESRLILDRSGAEKLLGRGDLLFASNHDPVRLQAPFLPGSERAAIFRGSGMAAPETVASGPGAR
jgi:hypothetical protein